jgi:hypothetical protein
MKKSLILQKYNIPDFKFVELEKITLYFVVDNPNLLKVWKSWFDKKNLEKQGLDAWQIKVLNEYLFENENEKILKFYQKEQYEIIIKDMTNVKEVIEKMEHFPKESSLKISELLKDVKMIKNVITKIYDSCQNQ